MRQFQGSTERPVQPEHSQPAQPSPPAPCTPPEGCFDYDPKTCECRQLEGSAGGGGFSPILMAVGQSSSYKLTGIENGVRFDLNSNGSAEQISWTHPDESVAFLVLDRNGNGFIDNGRELFGNFTPLEGDATASHGFEALAAWDALSGGGNGDGWIDAGDAVWSRLQLWLDANHNGISEPSELFSLASRNISRLSTHADVENRRDQYGNRFRFRGRFIIDGHPRWAHDVFFVGRE